MRGVTFDAGGTLLHADPPVARVWAAAGRRRGARVTDEEMERRYRAAWKNRPRPLLVSPERGRSGWRDVLVEAFDGLLPPEEFDPLLDALHAHFGRASAWRIADGALEAIARLHAGGWRTGVISNWDERLPQLLRTLGFGAHLDAIVVSAEVGCEKPDRRIFEEACRRLRLPPEDVVHVGDDPVADADGARAAGMDAVLVGKGGVDVASVVDVLYGRFSFRA